MKVTRLEENKNYVLRKKGRGKRYDVEITDITLHSACIDYWTFENINEYKGLKGTPFDVYAVVPRIAGSDFFVDNGGEILHKTVIVPFDRNIRLCPYFSLNPRTGEYICDDEYVLEISG